MRAQVLSHAFNTSSAVQRAAVGTGGRDDARLTKVMLLPGVHYHPGTHLRSAQPVQER
jgi:hypothetical protein